MYYNLFDSHSHSENSPDGEHAVTFMAEIAINKGLQGLAITDHCEGNAFEKWSFSQRIMTSAVSTAVAKTAFGKRLVMTFGIEIAQVFFNKDKIEELLNRHSFDFVIGSLHKLMHEGFNFFNADYSKISGANLDDYLIKYFEEIIDLINWGKIDVLGHLSFPLRYPKLKNNIDIDFMKYREHVDEILKLAAANGIGIEINTSGLRNQMNDTLPPAWTVKRFRELGGEIVTIGSDAHRANDLGEGIEHGMSIMADAGYKYFAFFKERKPVMLKII